MATNDFKPFATGASANVTSQTDWAALPALLSGFQSGKASSAQVNKALRQATFVAAALAQFVSDKSGQNVADDGNLAGFVSKLTTGFANQHLTRSNPFGDIKTDGAAAVSTALANLGLGEAAKRGVGTGVNQIPDMSSWTKSTGKNGWAKSPDGFIVQWGQADQTAASISVTFPIPFPNGVRWLSEHDNGGVTRLSMWQLGSVTGSGFTANNIASLSKNSLSVEASVSASCVWFAWGN